MRYCTCRFLDGERLRAMGNYYQAWSDYYYWYFAGFLA